MPENFPAAQFLRNVDKCFGVCIVNLSMRIKLCDGYHYRMLNIRVHLVDLFRKKENEGENGYIFKPINCFN